MQNLFNRKKYFTGITIAVLSGCGGGSGADTGNNSSRVTDQGGSVNQNSGEALHVSPDIYSTSAYGAVLNSSDAGVYVLIQHGTINYTLAASPGQGEYDERYETKVSRRQVLELRVYPDNLLHMVDQCSGADLGPLSSAEPISFSPELAHPGRYIAHYLDHVDAMPIYTPGWKGPFQSFAPPQSAADASPVIDVDVDINFDLQRIGSANGVLGYAQLDIMVNGSSNRVSNACIVQSHEEWHTTFVGAPVPNVADSIVDTVYITSPGEDASLASVMSSGDALALGNSSLPGGSIGTEKFAAFSLDIASPLGTLAYSNPLLTTHGETGHIVQTVISNDTWGLEFTGQAINDGGEFFESGSVSANYHVRWVLK